MADIAKIPNMVVDFGNGADVVIVVAETAYKVASRQAHPQVTAKVIELSGNRWPKVVAEEYIKNISVVSYYDAIDILVDCGKTIEEAVEFLGIFPAPLA